VFSVVVLILLLIGLIWFNIELATNDKGRYDLIWLDKESSDLENLTIEGILLQQREAGGQTDDKIEVNFSVDHGRRQKHRHHKKRRHHEDIWDDNYDDYDDADDDEYDDDTYDDDDYDDSDDFWDDYHDDDDCPGQNSDHEDDHSDGDSKYTVLTSIVLSSLGYGLFAYFCWCLTSWTSSLIEVI
jgi:hypothetical protein